MKCEKQDETELRYKKERIRENEKENTRTCGRRKMVTKWRKSLRVNRTSDNIFKEEEF